MSAHNKTRYFTRFFGALGHILSWQALASVTMRTWFGKGVTAIGDSTCHVGHACPRACEGVRVRARMRIKESRGAYQEMLLAQPRVLRARMGRVYRTAW